MSVFKHLKYQSALEEVVKNRKTGESETRFTLRRLAEEAGLQPSFLTNVLKERFDFNADQLYAVCEVLELTAVERRYLTLLLDFQRSTNKSRRGELKKEIDDLRAQNQKTEKHISARPVALNSDAMAEYYLDPFVQLAHVHLSLPPYTENPNALCGALGVSKSHLSKIFDVLTRIGYVVSEAGRIRVVAQNKHLPKENPLCDPHQALMRLKSIDQLSRLKSDNKYSFSVTLSGTEETRTRLQDEFLAFLKKAEAIVKPARAEKAFQMNFDLFPWES